MPKPNPRDLFRESQDEWEEEEELPDEEDIPVYYLKYKLGHDNQIYDPELLEDSKFNVAYRHLADMLNVVTATDYSKLKVSHIQVHNADGTTHVYKRLKHDS